MSVCTARNEVGLQAKNQWNKRWIMVSQQEKYILYFLVHVWLYGNVIFKSHTIHIHVGALGMLRPPSFTAITVIL